MRSSLWIAASAAALLCFGQTVGAQSAKQDDKGGASSGTMQRGVSGSGRQDGGAPGERKSSESKSGGGSSAGAAEGSQGSGRASSNASSDKSSPGREEQERPRGRR